MFQSELFFDVFTGLALKLGRDHVGLTDAPEDDAGALALNLARVEVVTVLLAPRDLVEGNVTVNFLVAA